MISAAKADGHIDDDERQKIAGKLSLAGIDSDAEKFLMAELESPLDLDTLVAGAQDRRPEARTLYRLAPRHRSRIHVPNAAISICSPAASACPMRCSTMSRRRCRRQKCRRQGSRRQRCRDRARQPPIRAGRLQGPRSSRDPTSFRVNVSFTQEAHDFKQSDRLSSSQPVQIRGGRQWPPFLLDPVSA